MAPVAWCGVLLCAAAIVAIGLKFHQWPGGIDPPGPKVPNGYLFALACAPGGFMFLAGVAGIIQRSGTITVTPDGELRLSWRAHPLRVSGAEVVFGQWREVAPVFTVKGTVAFILYRRRAVIVGGIDHDGHGYRLDGRATTRVDLSVDRNDFDRLLAAMRVSPDPSQLAADAVVDLTRNAQSPRSALRTLAPWLITILVIGGFGLSVGFTSFGHQLEHDPHGTTVVGAVITVAIIAGLLWTFIAYHRPSQSLALQLRSDELVLTRLGRGKVIARAPWNRVTAIRRRKIHTSKYGRSYMDIVELRITGCKPLRIGVWVRSGSEWGSRTYRGAHYAVGQPHWRRLINSLGAHRCFDN